MADYSYTSDAVKLLPLNPVTQDPELIKTLTPIHRAITELASAQSSEARTSYTLTKSDGTAATRDVYLTAGAWEVSLDTRATYLFLAAGAINATQDASISGVTVTTTLNWDRGGASGHSYLIHASDIAVATLNVTSPGTYTMTISAIALNGATEAKGSIMRLEKVS
jgi:hypothetical protein